MVDHVHIHEKILLYNFDKSLSHGVDYVWNDALLQLPHVCLSYCKPGCDCHTGKVSYELIIEHSNIIVDNLNKE